MRCSSILAAATSAFLILPACPATVIPTSPAEVVAAHLGASSDGERQKASRWLSLEARQRGYRWPEPKDLPRGTPREVRRNALWGLASGRRLEVQRESGGWKIRSGILGLDAADTPQQALSIFARAIESRDYGGLIRLMPEAERPRWTAKDLAAVLDKPALRAAWAALAAAIRANQGPVEVVWVVPGRRARISVSVNGHTAQVELIEQGAAWKVLDVAPRRLYTPAR